jgi:hypothetical protein
MALLRMICFLIMALLKIRYNKASDASLLLGTTITIERMINAQSRIVFGRYQFYLK